MKYFPMPGTDLTVPVIIAGMMRITEKTDEEIRTLYQTARDAGITFFDHADVYGGDYHKCEKRFADALNLTSSAREEIIIQTKAGINRWEPVTTFDFSRDHLVRQVEGSLKALKTDYIDILLLHRPDALVEPEEVAAAFDELAASGKVRNFGVSNHNPGQIALLKKYVTRPLVANQVQLSITHAPLIAQGIAVNMVALDQSIDRDNGLVDYCRLHDITLQAWSPFQAGFFNGPFIGNPDYIELNAVLDRLASKYGVTPDGIDAAWIVRHPANWQVVLGTTTPKRVQDAAAGADVELTRNEWYELFKAAGHILP